MLDVSAIVPVYNPGSNIDDLIESLVGQSLPRERYEVIFVDDGSTDGTGERLDELAARVPNVRVEHIPNSGWPGRPRNVGMDMARGEFVYFADNDDYLGREALERLHGRAMANGADVVVGKVVGRGKYVPRGLFTRNRDDVTLEWRPLVGLLTPHKLFRRELLVEHGIRFPEGRRRLEDHVFVMHAFFHARRISILADYPCYYWMLRDEHGANASYAGFEPAAYYANVREVLDLVEEHTEPGPLREQLLMHWYRGKMLGRVGGRYFPRRPPDVRRALYAEVRELARERYGDRVDGLLAWNLRLRSHLLREGTYEALERLAHAEAELRADVRVAPPRFEPDGTCVLAFEARLLGERERPLEFERRGERLLWVAPAELGLALPDGVLDATEALGEASVQMLIRARSDEAEYVLPAEQRLRLDAAGAGRVTPLLVGEARIEPGRAAAGAAPAAGRWDVLASVSVCGFAAIGRARARRSAAELWVEIDAAGAVVPRRTPQALSPAALRGLVARRVPRLARAVKRARDRRGAPAAG